MMEDQESRLRSVIEAAWEGLRLLLFGIAMLLFGIAAVVFSVVGFALLLVGLTVGEIARLIRVAWLRQADQHTLSDHARGLDVAGEEGETSPRPRLAAMATTGLARVAHYLAMGVAYLAPVLAVYPIWLFVLDDPSLPRVVYAAVWVLPLLWAVILSPRPGSLILGAGGVAALWIASTYLPPVARVAVFGCVIASSLIMAVSGRADHEVKTPIQ